MQQRAVAVGSSAWDSFKTLGSTPGVGESVGRGRVEDFHRLLQVPRENNQGEYRSVAERIGVEDVECPLYAIPGRDSKRVECSSGLRRHPLLCRSHRYSVLSSLSEGACTTSRFPLRYCGC